MKKKNILDSIYREKKSDTFVFSCPCQRYVILKVLQHLHLHVPRWNDCLVNKINIDLSN